MHRARPTGAGNDDHTSSEWQPTGAGESRLVSRRCSTKLHRRRLGQKVTALVAILGRGLRRRPYT